MMSTRSGTSRREAVEGAIARAKTRTGTWEQAASSTSSRRDLDERVHIPLDPEDALRALLRTEPKHD